MEKNDFLRCDLDDVVFEHRNRAYGAYILRKNYRRNLKRAGIWGFFSAVLLVASPLIGEKLNGLSTLEDNRVVELGPPPKAERKPDVPKPKIEPPKPEPPKKIATMKVVPPKVKDDDQIKEPDFIPKVDDITVAVSTKTQEGVVADLPPDAVAPPPIGAEDGEAKEEAPKKNDDDTPRSIIAVEQKPEFPDGERAMLIFLRDNVVYPAVARENGISGTVYVRFVVWKDGSIRQVEVVRKVSGGCSEEAERVVKKMPNWKPGRQNGRPVAVTYTLPVKFQLE